MVRWHVSKEISPNSSRDANRIGKFVDPSSLRFNFFSFHPFSLSLICSCVGGGGCWFVQYLLDDHARVQCLLDLLRADNNVRLSDSSMLVSNNSVYHGLHLRNSDSVLHMLRRHIHPLIVHVEEVCQNHDNFQR